MLDTPVGFVQKADQWLPQTPLACITLRELFYDSLDVMSL